MKHLDELKLPPGETIFVDGIHNGVARLLIGRDGERTETISVEALPEDARKESIYLRVNSEGRWERSTEDEIAAKDKTASLMEDVFGEDIPER
jgi:hypothetical protein